MPWYGWTLMIGVLRRGLKAGFVVALLLVGCAKLCAQKAQPVPITLSVVDKSNAAIAGASVKEGSGELLGKTDTNGQLTIRCRIPCRLRIEAQGFAGKFAEVSANTTVQLDPATAAQQITVTAYRAPLGTLESPVTTRVLSEQELSSTAAFTADGQVRQLPGVELFRRSSSLVANPTSQGISLRGLGSTSASRTLVTEDDVPLNDAVGGWIHWEEQPELAIDRIEVLRGGASDLYGSSAIGGVVNVVPMRPSTTMAEARSSYGGLGTYDISALLETTVGGWGLLASGGALGTDGFIQEAPFQRGPVDTASNMHGENGMFDAEHDRGSLQLFVRGSGFNEARANGTVIQNNGTRLWRYATGADWNAPRNATASLRIYGSTEHYRQTFSSISNAPTTANPACTFRCGETPTKLSLTPDNELGAAAHWNQPIGAEFLVVAGADVHDVRVWDREQTFGATGALTNLDDHQRDSAGYAEAMWTHNAWTATAAGRLDWFQNYDAHQVMWNGTAWVPTATQPPSRDEHIFDPRLGISRKLGGHWALSASGFRAFRAPTPSELYRSTQVGSKLTLPNSGLLSERATGWETGVASEWRWGTIRTSYFDTQVNRPIVAVTTNPNSSPILLKRENLGQIESRGVGIDFEVAPQRWLALDGGYQYAHAVVSRGTQDLGNWIPEVAHNMGSLNLRAFKPRYGTLSLQSRISGHQYDDDANLFLLHGYVRLDGYASHELCSRLELFAAAENLFDRTIEVSKTPTTTLATRRLLRAGMQLKLGGAK
ncbi:MAG TPA: TonB-dependent receptor [Terracidiphilus sp.]|jgi:outer membrane receptor protein involved in Fe transport